MEERLQKILSRCGYGSRRAAEEYITMGRVTVNGVTAELFLRNGIDVLTEDEFVQQKNSASSE